MITLDHALMLLAAAQQDPLLVFLTGVLAGMLLLCLLAAFVPDLAFAMINVGQLLVNVILVVLAVLLSASLFSLILPRSR